VRGYLADLRATAETPTGPDDEPAASVEEVELVLRWMEKPGTRLVEVTGTLACRAPGTGPLSGFLARVEAGRAARAPFADTRPLATHAQPDRVVPGSPAAGQPQPRHPSPGGDGTRAAGRVAARRARVRTGLASPA
jgi:DNA polymerase-3 subunit epsilon